MSDYVAISRIESKLDRILKIIDTPVDEYVPVKREVWDHINFALGYLGISDHERDCGTEGCLVCRALAEIGGEDD